MWDLTGPPDAEPMVLGRGPVTTIGAVFEPTGRWLTAEDLNGVTFWPATGRWPSVMRVSAGASRDVAFDPNGKWIAASAGRGGVEIWPSTVNGFPRRHIAADVSQLAVSPDGQFLATGTRSGSVLVLPVAGSGFRELRGFQGLVDSVAFDATGRRIAADGPMDGGRSHVIRVFDLQTGDVKTLRPRRRKRYRHRRVSAGWRPAHLELWRTATPRFGNRVFRTPARAAGRGIPRSRRPTRPAAPNRRTSKSLWVRLPCMTCANGAAGRCRHTETR